MGSLVEAIFEKLISSLLGGGPNAIVAIMLIAIVALVIERKRLLADIKTKEERIEKIVEDYYKGNMTLTEALNSLRMVLYEIKSKI